MKALDFCKKEPVLSISFAAALVSCFFVRPDAAYIEYLDLRTLALLYALMVVVEGLSKAGLFRKFAGLICRRASNLRILGISLVALSFASSMLITNDVALITFVPFSVLVLTMTGMTDSLIWIVVVQTIAANMGSMLTPVGNPQNLYLFSYYGLSFGEFFAITLPVWILSLIVCILLCFRLKKTPLAIDLDEQIIVNKRMVVLHTGLFLLCLLVVFRFLPWYVMLAAVIVILFFADRPLLGSADFLLLLTFVCFFVFSGNLARINAVKELMGSLLNGRELLVSALASQCISNVPAALLLSSFTDNARGLILGTDIGGLGTPIASMASLISYKIYCAAKEAKPGPYMRTFLITNVVLLVLFLIVFTL